MCQAQQTEQMPLNAGPTSIPDDPLAGSLQSDAPDTVGVKTPTKFGRALQVGTMGAYDPTNGQDSGPRPTKFGALMKFIGPALEGGFVGLAGGKGHPQGGFGAANDHFQQKRALEIQRALLQRQAQNDQIKNALEVAKTQHEVNMPRYPRIPNAIKGVDKDGNPIIKVLNGDTGEWEIQPDIFPADKADHFTAVRGDSGEYSFNTTNGQTQPIMVPDPNAPQGGTSPLPLGPRRVNPRDRYSGASASPQTQKANAPKMIPLRPSGFSTPKPTIRASRNAAGVETDNILDTNPNSKTFGKQIGSTGNTRAPLPDRSANRLASRQAQKDSDTERSETYAGEALKRSGNDPDKAISYLNSLKIADPKAAADFNRLLPSIRKSIADRTKQRKPKAKNALGISDADWQSLVGGSSQQSTSDDDE